jgi:release factor glutamine methyltransferase
MDIRQALRDGTAHLDSASIPSSSLAAELLLIHALGCDRTWLYTHPEAELDQAVTEKYFVLIARRSAGEPTQYLTSKQEFWGLEFEVTPAVLIPRPETEHLIEVAIDRIGPACRNNPLRIADVGTGSGCIAVALAKEFPNARIVATDISPAALEVAKRNAVRHDVDRRIEFTVADLLNGGAFHESQVTSHESRSFDLIASNPPYIAEADASTLHREVRDHEPHAALFGGSSGIEIYPRLIAQAESLLKPGGQLIVELGFGQADSVQETLKARHAWENLSVTNDLAGIPRILAAELDATGRPAGAYI